MLKHIETVVALKLAPRNYLRYLQANSIMRRRGTGLKIYVMYSLIKKIEHKNQAFWIKATLLNVLVYQMVWWLLFSCLTTLLLKKMKCQINERYNDFFDQKIILGISNLFFFFYMLYCTETKKLSLFFTEYTIKVVRKVSSIDQTICCTPRCL